MALQQLQEEPMGSVSDDDLDLPRAEYLWRRLRLALVEAREATGLSQKQVAAEMGWSVSKVSRIEQGIVTISPSDVRATLSLFGASREVIQEHVDVALEARTAKSWSDFDDAISPEYMNYIGLEQSASQIYKYETAVVPGLLQTREYSMALFEEVGVPGGIAERRGEVRQLRQQVLDHADGPELFAVMTEFALVRCLGGPQIMRQQIEHLFEASRSDRVSLFLMPFSAGGYPGMDEPFAVLTFRDASVPPALFLEDGLKRVTTSVDDTEVLDRRLKLFHQITKKAERAGRFEQHATRILDQYYPDTA